MQVDSIRNSDGIWINSKTFSEEATHFKKYGYYTSEQWGSPGWIKYWLEQEKRCTEGYSVGGAKITGHHYSYLNFCQIRKAEGNKKITDFPDFWDGDYNFYWVIDIARDGISLEDYKKLQLEVDIKEKHIIGRKHVIITKARRKGYSFKFGKMSADVYSFLRESSTLICGFDKKYAYDTMKKAKRFLNFIDKNTGWRKNRLTDTIAHIKAGYEEFIDGVKVYQGYLSEIEALTFQNNPDAARGKDAHLILFEEMGTFNNAVDSFEATDPSTKAGENRTGMICAFGTGSSMDAGAVDFAKMFYNPDEYNFIPFKNVWDENSEEQDCGFFHPVFWNKEGYYDKQGNSQIEEAIDSEKAIRKTRTSSSSLQAYSTEFPFNPAESFQSKTASIFPVAELRQREAVIKSHNLHIKTGQPCELVWNKSQVKVIPDLKHKLTPLYQYTQSYKDISGAVIIYEYPVTGVPRNFYKIGFDPYAQDQSTGPSFGSIVVYKPALMGQYRKSIIAATYTGRPDEANDVSEIAYKLAVLYNTEIMYENMFKHVKDYFRLKKALNRLAAQPDMVISKSIRESKVARVYGIHMVAELKDSGEKYIKDWLLKVIDYDDQDEAIRCIDQINDLGLIQELISYNRKRNTDRVMSLMMALFQVQEEKLIEDDRYQHEGSIYDDLLNLN